MSSHLLYAKSVLISSYIASAEGGLRESIASKTSHDSRVGASIGVKNLVNADAGKVKGYEDLTTIKDTDSSRLQRLIDAGRANPDQLGWVEVTQPEKDFRNIGLGAMIDWECEIYVPEFSSMISMHDQFDKFAQIIGPAKQLGLNLKGIPDQNELSNMAAVLKVFDSGTMVIGEVDDSEWKIAGRLDVNWISQDVEFDGFARIIAKVIKRIDQGKNSRFLLFRVGE